MSTDALIYDKAFYDRQQLRSRESAEVVVPLVNALLSPQRVVDVGCGVGTWAAVFAEQGAEILGIDGEYVANAELQISRDQFYSMDLTVPEPLNRRFDLTVCLEVAEHLPAECARPIVKFLVSLAPLVLFSAAIPGQPGVCHINPAWPCYWRNLFRERNFISLDPFRPLIWHDERVAPHYRQNLFLYVDGEYLASTAGAGIRKAAPMTNCLTLIDEDVLQLLLGPRESLRRIIPRFLKKLL